MNLKLHVLADAIGRPIGMFLWAGQTWDCIGARALLSSIPQAGVLLADRGYDADWFRNALIERDIQPCIPSRNGRKFAIEHDRVPLPPLPPSREHVCTHQGLAAHRRRLRPMPDPLPVRLRLGSNRHLLVMSLEPGI